MVKALGKIMDKATFLQYFGEASQYASATPLTITSGNANGVNAVEIKTGSGLQYTVLPSRALDIAYVSYKGIPIAWISKTGIVNPKFYESDGDKWLRNFYGGLLTTSGLTNVGTPCIDNGKSLGLHGRISNSEAYDLSVRNDWVGNDLMLSVSGKVRESVIFGENLEMERKIITRAGSSKIFINTNIENLGFEPQPLMLLFHINFGFPLLSPDSKIHGLIKKVTPRDDQARADNGVENFNKLTQPTHEYKEKVFFLEFRTTPDGETEILLFNPNLEIGVYEKYNINELPFFTMWKQMGEGDYVLGLEPGTALPLGRDKVKERGELMMIEAGETKEFNLEIGIIEGKDAIEREMEKIDKLEELKRGFF